MIRDPACVLIDLQNDFCNPEFVSDDTDLSDVLPAIQCVNRFLKLYRASDRTPIFVRTTHRERTNSQVWNQKYEGRDRSMPCRPGTPGADFHPDLDVRPSDAIVTKHRYNGFHQTDLETYLSANDVSHLLVGGVNTNICIASTVYDAYDRDYRVTVLSDCTATTRRSRHDSTLENIEAHFGSVRHSSEIDLQS